MSTPAPPSGVTAPDGAALVLATHNPGKLAELQAVLAPLVPDLDPRSIISAASLGVPEPVEDGLTFAARWCGRHGDDAGNLRLLLDQISAIADPHRTARFTCAAVLAAPGPGPDHRPTVTRIERSMEGRLLGEPRGEGGFGYDPIFVPVQEDAPGGAGRTTAQMSSAEKNAISHRGQALRALAPVLAALLSY